MVLRFGNHEFARNTQDCFTTIHETRVRWFGKCFRCATTLMANALLRKNSIDACMRDDVKELATEVGK